MSGGAERHGLEDQLENYRAYYGGWGVRDREDGDLSLYRSGLPYARLNAVTHNASISPQTVAEVQSRMAGVPYLWEVSDISAPGTAETLLAEGGTYRGALTVMAMDLRTSTPEQQMMPALDIVELSSAEPLGAWVHAYSPSMGLSSAPEAEAHLREVEQLRRYPDGEFTRFVGLVDGRIVSTTEVLISRGLAGIYLVTTAAAFRGRGFATALILRALESARAAGAEVATLQASGSGEPVYEAMGFVAISKIDAYTLPNL